MLPVGDTLARVGETLGEPVDRTGLVRVQTPQAFRLAALAQPMSSGKAPPRPMKPPSCALREWRSPPWRAIPRSKSSPSLRISTAPNNGSPAGFVPRTGMGFDVHAFAGDGPSCSAESRFRISRGLAGHSDADVVLHAITDALLGAAGLGDIGEHFPPTDPRWKGAPSSLFLAHAAELLRDKRRDSSTISIAR